MLAHTIIYHKKKKKKKNNNLPFLPKYVCTRTYCTVATKSKAKITSNCKSQLFFPAPNPLWIWYAGKLPSKQTTNFPKQEKKNYDTHQTKYKEKHKNRMYSLRLICFLTGMESRGVPNQSHGHEKPLLLPMTC